MKKGLLFTLSILLIVSLVLTIAILNFKNTQKTKNTLSEVGSIERAYNLGNSVANGFKEIFNTYSGINISLVNETLTFEEFLPNTNSNLFKSNIDNYKSYIENDDKNIKLNIDKLKEDLSLVILPHNITYKHNSFGGNQIIILPNQVNYKKYFVYIKDINITSCTWNTYPGTLIFELDVDNAICDNTQNIDISRNNSININNNGIIIYMNNSLSIINNLGSVKVKTSITLDNIQNERITIESQEGLININYQNLNISKSSGFRII